MQVIASSEETAPGRKLKETITPVIVTAVVCVAAGACALVSGSNRPALVSQDPYQAWSCEQLSQEIARSDAGITKGQKNAIEQVMLTKGCIHPLAAETE